MAVLRPQSQSLERPSHSLWWESSSCDCSTIAILINLKLLKCNKITSIRQQCRPHQGRKPNIYNPHGFPLGLQDDIATVNLIHKCKLHLFHERNNINLPCIHEIIRYTHFVGIVGSQFHKHL